MRISDTRNINVGRLQGHIPIVQSENEKDRLFGIGYCHAIDRGMQLMVMKILGQGRATELLADTEEMLEVDMFFRKMNWQNNTEEEIKKFTEEEIELLNSYCEGVEKGFQKQKPWELRRLLGIKAFSWTIRDCLLITRMTGFLTLAQSQGEIERLFIQMVQNGVTKDNLEELFPGILEGYDETLIRKVNHIEKLIPDSVRWNVATAPFMASNNWVVSGSKSESGKPILANDPHLEINRLPSVWYEIATQCNTNYIHGASMPGIPSIIIGRSNSLSWGVTYAFMDAIDSWIEECKDGKFFKDGKWEDFKVREEIIYRKKSGKLTLRYYENDHGTLEGDPRKEGFYLTSQWSGNCSGARTLKAGLHLSKAKTVQEGMKIVGMIESAFSWVFADTNGNIGMQMSGLFPIRREGLSGFFPMDGRDSKNDWRGYNNAVDLPRSINPKTGFITTANNDLNHLGIINPINMPMGDYRVKRIEHLLTQKEKFSMGDFKKMHYDTYSIQAELFMEIINPLLPQSKNGKILQEWDCCYELDSKGAYLFEMIYRSLQSEVFGNALGKDILDFLSNETGIFIDFYQNFDRILLSEKSKWFGNMSRDELYRKAIKTALDRKAITWGKFNSFIMEHIVLGRKLPKFMGFDKGPFPMKGGRATIHQGQIFRSANRQSSFAPSFRIVTDMNERKLYTNNAGGVSDRRFSKHYNNDFENWFTGIYKSFEFK